MCTEEATKIQTRRWHCPHFLIALAVIASCSRAIPVSPPPTKFFSRRPTEVDVDRFLQSVQSQPCNHGMQGRTLHLPGLSEGEVPGELRRGCLKGWRIVRKEVGLGRGREVYERATRALREWRMHDGSRDTGIFVHPESGAAATLARAYFGLAWVLNPIRVSYTMLDVRDQRPAAAAPQDGKRTWSAVAYMTVGRHLIAGEERMRVVLHEGSGEVVFDVCSISRAAGLLKGRLAFPFTTAMQAHFFEEQLRCMRAIAANGSSP